jgi:hypothetical protein
VSIDGYSSIGGGSKRGPAKTMRGRINALVGILERSSRPKRPPPAPEKGVLLLQLDRRREDGILRGSWCTLEAGEPFLQVRLWRRDNEGTPRPTRRGAVVRLREMAAFGEAVEKALDLAHQYGQTKAR